MERWEQQGFSVAFEDGVAVVTMKMDGKVNKVNEAFLRGLDAAVTHAHGLPGVKGLVITSGHRDFCVGADLEGVYQERDPARMLQATSAFHALHLKLETGVPVVAALNGSALGGGWELALACHARVAVEDPRVQLGCPEVLLGLIPGGGGTQRLPRLLGIQAALELLTQGTLLRPEQAAKRGLVQRLVPAADQLVAAAREWIAANPRAKQPWNQGAFVWPGGVQPGTPDARNLLLAASGLAYQKTAGVFPAVEAVISAVQEGSLLVFERALEVEARHFAALVVSDQAKDMIRTMFFHKTAVDRQEGLPRVEDPQIRKVAVLGAGMMGAGLAFVCAKAGMDVVLKDISAQALEAGVSHVRREVASLKHLDATARDALLARVKPTLAVEDCAGADLVIEAIVENKAIKHAVTRETEPHLAASGIWASNTSAIPIRDLAVASAHPERFIGLHFFSPVEKMPLLEIITAERTTDETLARALAFGRAIKKTCIVVNDGYGFFTSRVFSAYILEGAQLAAEGHDPVLIEWAARTAGMVVPPLQVFDEVTLALGKHALEQAAEYRGPEILAFPGVQLVQRMVGLERTGKAGGAGFYDYPGGKRAGIWPGLAELCGEQPADTGLDLLQRRLMFAQLAEVGRALADGIIRQPRDAEVGAIFGIGFAPNTGGPLAMMDRLGLDGVARELNALADRYGDRFRPSPTLVRMAERGERFFPAV